MEMPAMQINICPDLKEILPEQEEIQQIRVMWKHPWEKMERTQVA